MMQTTGQNVAGSPSQTNGGNASWMGGFGNLLKDSFGMYLQYDAMKKAQHPASDLVEKQHTVELANGGATVIDNQGTAQQQQAVSDKVNVLGMQIPKAVAYIGGAILALVAVKKWGFYE